MSSPQVLEFHRRQQSTKAKISKKEDQTTGKNRKTFPA